LLPSLEDKVAEPDSTYVDAEGYFVEVFGEVHRTQLGEKRWAYSTGPRATVSRHGSAPAYHDGAFYQGGAFKYAGHGQDPRNPTVVEDLACDEGKAVWGKNYVKTADGREGPTVESIRSPKRLKEYMELTGHRVKEPGEPDQLKERRREAARKINPRIQEQISKLMGD
jgi:hypothetical protein